MLTIAIDDNLALRSFKIEDAIVLFDIINRNRQHLRPWLTWVDQIQSAKEAEQFILDSFTQIDNQAGLELAIIFDGKIIGSVGMQHWNHQLNKAQIGYWITKEFEGKGIMNKCLMQFIKYLFTQVGLNKIEIHFVSSNQKSASVIKRLNAPIEGILRDSYFTNGTLSDLVIAGILKKDFLNQV